MRPSLQAVRASGSAETSQTRPSMQFQAVLLVPGFLAVELARTALWAARTTSEPDRNDGLLPAFLALLAGIFGLMPRPTWTLVAYAAQTAWVPVRGVLWVWGIGRGGSKKRSPAAVTRWYAIKRRRRAEALRRSVARGDDDDDGYKRK